MSLESFAEKILTDIKADLANLVNLIKGQKTLENGESNATLDEASLNAHAANILRNHASKITGESAGTPQQPTQQSDQTQINQQSDAQPEVPVQEGQAPANTADTNSTQSVSQSSQGNESTVPSTPTSATPTTNDGA